MTRGQEVRGHDGIYHSHLGASGHVAGGLWSCHLGFPYVMPAEFPSVVPAGFPSGHAPVPLLSFPQVFSGNPVSFFLVPSFM